MPALLAAIALPAETDADAFLGPLVSAARAAGLFIGGMLAPADELKDMCRCAMFVEDLISGERIKISQDLGPESNSCSLDPGQLIIAGRFIRGAIEAGVDLIVVNKFGKREAAGEGLRDEIAGALEAGTPLLTTVKPEILDAWIEFVGEFGCVLRAEPDAVLQWFTQIRPPAQSGGATLLTQDSALNPAP